ncbi:E3 ubiquitin-protein ligase KEG-like [Penaeus chinensis]|uniref:E3 ubiquitin-protein ligase KEG-like n=1 Tax=Penaeus chinensis TaxID=139456 RepID=UPI001FB66C62|nr:E3 ubiquitin-protein ligase KEG-like [Penaeus chinensis]XP_047471125.1 E3 ubiquitin-protein ligase KEG-like [Penaeus chinensis]
MRCKLCKKGYDSRRHVPLILPSCGHTFCRMCLLELEEEETHFDCPRCDKLHKRPSVQNLQINWDSLEDEDDSKKVAIYRTSSATGQSCSGFKIGGSVNLGFGVNDNGVCLGVNATGGVAIDEFKMAGNFGLGFQAGPHGAMINGQAGLAVGLGQDAFICGGNANLGIDPLPRIGANGSWQIIPGGNRSITF